MRGFRSGACALLFAAVAALAAQPEEPFPPKGSYNDSVHRYFPDLDSRLNAVRYGRWRALQIAWNSGINPELDRRYSSYLLGLLAGPPRFPPEAERVAPRLAREAIPVFRALRWAQVLETQTLDVLGSPDANPRLSAQRLQRVLDLYRRERWALSEPDQPAAPVQVFQLAPISAHILLSGTRLFALAIEDLVASDFGAQRWKVKSTVQEFDRSYTTERPVEQASYRVSAPSFAGAYPLLAEHLDRITRFRTEIFNALVSGSESIEARRLRDTRTREVAARYRLPVEGIGER